MKKVLIFVVACVAMAFTAGAQQQGVVRSVERPKQPSKGIAGATVNILELKNDLVTDKYGKFSFTIRGKKTGDPFKVSRVRKNGYTLIDKHLVGRKFSYSFVPIEIVMVSDKQLANDKKLIENKAYAKAKKTYEARIAELERQLAEKTISEQAYYAERELANNDYYKYIQLIDELAERYAMTDYKGLSDINRQIQECIENAELERADSLINSKGDFDQREQELRSQMEMNQATAEFLTQSQQDAEFKLNDLAQDYYNKYTIFAANYRNDSAAYWLKRRAALDVTNMVWQYDAGRFIYDSLAYYSQALEYYHRGLQVAIAQDSEQSEWTATFYNSIGEVYKGIGDYSRASEYFNKALEIYKNVFGEYHPYTATTYNNIGEVYYNQGEYDQALEYFNKALEIREKELGEDHTDIVTAYNNLGWVYYEQGEYDQALEYYNNALEIEKKVLRENHPKIATSFSNIGRVYYAQGEYDQTLEYYNKALEIDKKVFGEGHPYIATSFSNIGGVYYALGEYDHALEYYLKALVIREKVLGEDYPDTGKSYYNVGFVYYDMEEYGKSLEFFSKAYDIFMKVYGPDHPDTQEAEVAINVLNDLLGQ